HTSHVTNDGKIIFFGGSSNTSDSASVEMFDPKTDTWTALSNMPNARCFAHKIELADGRLIFPGGAILGGAAHTHSCNYGNKVTSLFDISTNSWTNTGNLNSERYNYGITLLADGRVLVA